MLSVYALADSLPALPADIPLSLRDSAVTRHRTHVLTYERASIEQLRRARPEARIVELRDTHHHLFLQRRDEIARLVREFLLER